MLENATAYTYAWHHHLPGDRAWLYVSHEVIQFHKSLNLAAALGVARFLIIHYCANGYDMIFNKPTSRKKFAKLSIIDFYESMIKTYFIRLMSSLFKSAPMEAPWHLTQRHSTKLSKTKPSISTWIIIAVGLFVTQSINFTQRGNALTLCWVSLCWVSLCWVSLYWVWRRRSVSLVLSQFGKMKVQMYKTSTHLCKKKLEFMYAIFYLS